jgi:hypothetical protein
MLKGIIRASVCLYFIVGLSFKAQIINKKLARTKKSLNKLTVKE